MLTLDLAMITYKPEGIRRVAAMSLPKVEGVRYVVSWQQHEDAPVPDCLVRDDIDIYRFDLKGLSLNRNNAIDNCKDDIILLADDDIKYTKGQLRSIIEAFENNPDTDLATFICDQPQMPAYPTAVTRLSEPLPKGYWAGSCSIAFRRTSTGDLRFHPELGLNSPRLHGGEDELFLLAAMRRGLVCKFFPIAICTHPSHSTGTTAEVKPGTLRAQGCYMAIAYRYTWLPRIILKARRTSRSGNMSFMKSLGHLIAGACCSPKVLRADRKYLW